MEVYGYEQSDITLGLYGCQKLICDYMTLFF